MISYIEGEISEKNPAYVIINCNGIGYMINISLYTHSKIPESGDLKLYTHLSVREDAFSLYGFISESEKELFKHLISVSGVGPNTARVILSSYSPNEINEAILAGQAEVLQSVKGIGAKTAQRVVVDLKDKLKKESDLKEEFFPALNNTIRNEALSALVMLGFAKNSAEKVLNKLMNAQEMQNLSAENLVKEALKRL